MKKILLTLLISLFAFNTNAYEPKDKEKAVNIGWDAKDEAKLCEDAGGILVATTDLRYFVCVDKNALISIKQ